MGTEKTEMATSTLLRAAGGLRLMQIAWPRILQKTTPALCNAVVQKKPLSLTPVNQVGRIYGPSHEQMPEITSHRLPSMRIMLLFSVSAGTRMDTPVSFLILVTLAPCLPMMCLWYLGSMLSSTNAILLSRS